MKPYIVQLEIDDRKSIVYCKDGTIYKGRCIGDCIVTNDDGEDEVWDVCVSGQWERI